MFQDFSTISSVYIGIFLQQGDSGMEIKLIKVRMLSNANTIRLWLVRQCVTMGSRGKQAEEWCHALSNES